MDVVVDVDVDVVVDEGERTWVDHDDDYVHDYVHVRKRENEKRSDAG